MVSIKWCQVTLFLLFACCLNPPATVEATADEANQVEAWAKALGDELWDLAQRMTKSQQITQRYKKYNARVMHKSGEELIETIVENVGRMFFRKIEAVRCILMKAENVSEQLEYNETMAKDLKYYSSKYSTLDNKTPAYTLPESMAQDSSMYRPMYFNQDTHFYNISVNTTHSSVHVPTNIYDRSPDVVEALHWSNELDEVFVQNYNSDPALSWQYFGSETGILRHYPAMAWEGEDVDTYDCRRRSWYIETATCSKDVVILLDNSGSMSGFRNYVAQNTVRSILETFSNNDFITIFNYSAGISEVVPCFSDRLVQATPENIAVFNSAVQELVPEGYANVSNAFIKAFQLLEHYRHVRECNKTQSGCNQAIMLISDGIPGNLTEVFERYNRIDINGTVHTPVRIFTYLLGKEVTKVREIQWMACLNRGYYSHIQTLDEIQEEVLKYVSVVALPLVLQEEAHPPTWTHAFKDRNYKEEGKNAPPRLMISVGVPAFDKKANKVNETKTARLLGVAGTDMPVEDIDKLTLPYKLGVNGYSFIVSNNGYVLLHPDLRPVSQGEIKLNYNSIDMTEVEQFNDNTTERHVGDDLLKLRTKLVNSERGSMLDLAVRFHYDNFRRASIEYQDYFFAPLIYTPFTLALVLPNGYGNTWIKVNNEIYGSEVVGLELAEFFKGDNWKVHPDWVYCKYHYLEGHEFKTPEAEFRHFLTLFSNKFKWFEQYEAEPNKTADINAEPNCGRKTLGDDAYYCNRELVQLLLFDAKVTNESYGQWRFESEAERQLINSYNATLRFIATMSGLTRWQFIHGEVEVDSDKEFGDSYKRAIDETWYRSAVLQHKIDPQSFVYSVPHESEAPEDEEIKVTASHAIFPRDGGLEAPAAVVGFQFSHQLLYERFMEIISTNTVHSNSDTPLCNSIDIDCFVIDNNGYIVISENLNDTGRFFGKVNGGVMEAMVVNGTFERIVVYDWQALCSETEEVSNDAHLALTPFRLILLAVKYLLGQIFWTLSKINSYVGVLSMSYDDQAYYDSQDPTLPTQRPKTLRKGQNQEEEDYFNRNQTPIYEERFYACDKQYDLYDLDEQNLAKNDGLDRMNTSCSTTYFLRRITNSNLLLLAVDGTDDCGIKLTTEGIVIQYNESFPCHKLEMNNLMRRRLAECFTDHEEEADVHYCGGAEERAIAGGLLIISIVAVFRVLF